MVKKKILQILSHRAWSKSQLCPLSLWCIFGKALYLPSPFPLKWERGLSPASYYEQTVKKLQGNT